MRATEFLAEAVPLNLSKLTKREGRADIFIDLIKKGHEFDSKIGKVKIDPKTTKGIQLDIENQNSRMMIATVDGKSLPLGTIYYDDAVFSAGKTGTEASKAGDTNIQVKPAQVFKHGTPEKEVTLTPELAINLGAFPAKDLGAQIIGNQHLVKQGPAGKAVIEIAKQMLAGQVPAVPNLDSKTITSIQNDAYEYLGVLALIHNVANFPASDEFYKHLGANISDSILLFPGSTTNPMSDSYALVDKATGNQIFISSKGGAKSGAASSIKAIKLPEHFAKAKDPTTKFIRALQDTSQPANLQPFKMANYIFSNFPGKLGNLEQFLPFDDDFFGWILNTYKNARNGVPEKVSQVPNKYRPFFKFIASRSQTSKYGVFWNSRYVVKDIIQNAVNRGQIVPNFSAKMIEAFEYNFIVIKTKPKGGKFVTDVSWPAKMGGKIELVHKDPADKWGGAITWKLL